MKRRTLLAFGAFVFVLTAAFQLPANRLQGWFGEALASSGLTLHGVEGTLAKGQLARVDRQGRPVIQDLGWTLQKLHLLIGRASFRLGGGRDGTLIDGTAFLLPSGTLGLRNLRAGMPATEALGLAGYPMLPVDGQAGIDIQSLDLRRGWPHKAQGTLTLRGLGWKLGREPVVLGDYEALIENETAGIKATVRSLGGALEVNGEARAGQDRAYELHLQLRPRPDAPPMVANLLRNLGQPDNQGWTHLRQRGQVRDPASATPTTAEPSA